MAGMLDGYSFAEWPNLSSNRTPPNRTHVTTKKVDFLQESSVNNTNIAAIIVAIARVIGAYCGISDVLLAIQTSSDRGMQFVRVSWNKWDTWGKVVSNVISKIWDLSEDALSLDAIKQTMALNDTQHPFLALCNFDSGNISHPINFPPVFAYDSRDSLIQLSAPLSMVHPSTSGQIITQVTTLIVHALQSPLAELHCIPNLPSDLMSIFERASDDAVISAYPHLLPVAFAPDYLSRRAQDMPHATAVCWYPELCLDQDVFYHEDITYLQLHRKSNQIARWLLRLGLQQEDRVAVCMDRNLNFHSTMMGIMRAGGCYVPIDPELPLERKVYIAEDAKAAFVITSSEVSTPEVFGKRTLYLGDAGNGNAFEEEISDDLHHMTPNGLAYLLYTSGTTGNPKGCLLTHRGLSQAILALSSTAADVRMDNIHDGRYLAVASIAFDVHLAETIVPIALGMPLLSARRSQLLENLPVYVNSLGITHLGIVPSLIEATLNASQGGSQGSDIALRYIASGGEKMSDSILDKWADHPQVRLANFYGPSEVTIGCCARYMSSSTPKSNIGRPFANVSAYVVDTDMNILLKGGIGELVVEGPLVGRGYHGRDDLTSKVFLEWPRKGCWSYRTGDLVRMMPDSTIEILGRIDTQIKLRGVRIESEGISAIVRRAIPSSDSFVLDATTVLAKHPAINVDQLVSFFTWDNTVPISTRKSKKPHLCVPPSNVLQQIKTICESELPSYMRPSHFVPLSWLPLSSNGKTDEKGLIAFFKTLSVEEIAQISTAQNLTESRPCTDLENKIFDILQNHVNLLFDRSRPEINVFECGLDSMGVIRFASELKKAFSVRIAASEIMKSPCIADIASHLSASGHNKLAGSSYSSAPNIDVEEIQLNYEPSHIENLLPPFVVQEGVLSRSAEMDTLYVQHVLISCKPGVSIPGLRFSWAKTVERYDILRTVFHFGRVLTQVVLKPEFSPLAWEETEIRTVNQESFRDLFLAHHASHITTTINRNISTIAPYRLSAYFSAGQTFLVLSIHHSLFDGISLPRIFTEVERDYLHLSSNPTASASDILECISMIDLSSAKSFWEKHLSRYNWPREPLLSSKPSRTKRLIHPFKESLSSFKKIAASHHVTVQALFTCAFSRLLALQVYQRKDVVFGVLRSGRLLPLDNIEDSLSPLVSILPLRINFKPGLTLQDVQNTISSSIEYEHVPLGKVQSWIRPGKPLFEILFSLSGNDSRESTLWDVIESEPPEADYPLAIEIVMKPQTDSIILQAAWMDKDAFENKPPADWLRKLESVIRSIAEDPTFISRFISDIPDTSSTDVHTNDTADLIFIDEDSVNDPLLDALRPIISNFMGLAPALLTDSTSLISMGLDSIKSVGLAKTLDKQGFKITSTDILRNATLVNLAKILRSNGNLEDLSSDSNTASIVEITIPKDVLLEQIQYSSTDKVDIYPTTALQTGMLSQTLNSSGLLYVHTFPLRISAHVDLDRLREAWLTAVENISILRTTFHFSTDSGLWFQAVHSTPVLDWSTSLSTSQNYKEDMRAFLESVDLSDETGFLRPPFRLRLFQSSQEDATSSLVILMHHALYDGTSVGKLLANVENIYSGSPAVPQVQFHELLPHFMNQEKRGTFFWFNRVRRYKSARLPLVHPSVATFTSSFSEITVALDAARMKDIIGRAGITMQCIGQAAWAKLLSKYTGLRDVIFGHTISGRGIPGAEDVIGPVLNTIPFCIRLDGDIRNMDLLKAIHQANMDALPWQQASIRSVQKALMVDQIWDSLFLFQHADKDANPLQPPLWSFDDAAAVVEEVKIQYPLNVEMFQQESSIVIKCASQSQFIDQQHLDDMMGDLHKIIDHISSFPEDLILSDITVTHSKGVIISPSCRSKEDGENLQAPSGAALPTTFDADLIAYQPLLVSLTNAPLSLMRLETPLSALGVDSIMAIQIVGKFRQSGMKLTARDVISSRTIGDLLAKAKPLQKTATVPPRNVKSPIDDSERASILAQFGSLADKIENIYSMTSGMKWLIGAWSRSAETRFQHAFAFRLPIDVKVETLRAAWYDLIRRHAILRSTFALTSGYRDLRLVVFKEAASTWVQEYLEEGPVYDSVVNRMKVLVANPPPLSSPLARAHLLHTVEGPYLALHLHHFQYDAWSLQLLLQELSCLYHKQELTASNALVPFLDYYLPAPDHLSEQQKYWQSSFPIPFIPTVFPASNPVPSQVPSTQRLIRTDISCITDSAACESRALQLGLSLQSVFLACWASVQARVSLASTSTFGLWHSGRTGSFDNIASLAVPCMNVLPLHVPSLDEKTCIETAKWIQVELQKRTSIIEQSDLVQVNEWLGVADRPLCNVFVNIIKVAPGGQDSLFEPLQAPYYVPSQVSSENGSYHQSLAISHLISDDLMIDIATISERNSVMVSIDAAAAFLDEDQADILISQWATCVKETLGLL